MNKVILLGNLTRDPDLRDSKSGSKFCNFGIAINEKWGEKEKVIFLDVVAFGRKAELMEEYFKKGSRILIDGQLDYNSWETDSGDKRNKVSVILNNFSFVNENVATDKDGVGKTDSKPDSKPDSKSESKDEGKSEPVDEKKSDDIPF